MSRIRGGKPRGQLVRVGVPDRALTSNAGLAAVSELCGRLGVIGALDDAVGPVKQRDRGFSGRELLTGVAVAQLLCAMERTGAQSSPGVPRLRSADFGPCTREGREVNYLSGDGIPHPGGSR